MKSPRLNFKVPVVNLSSELSVKERKQLDMGLEFSFVDKNRHLKKQLAANFETLSLRANDFFHHQNLEDFHEFLRAYTNIYTKDVYEAKDFTYSDLKNIIKNDKSVVLDLFVGIMLREDYDMKLQNMIDDGISQGIYSPTVDTYLKPLCQNEYKINDTQSFASQIKEQPPLNENEEYVSYDVDSLFTNIPVQETIDHIIHQIYTEKKLPQICSKTIFRRLLLKVITECSFQLKQKLYKQTEGYSMGGPLSVTLADIQLVRTENDVVKPLKLLFYKRYLDNISSRRKKSCSDQLYHELNNCHLRSLEVADLRAGSKGSRFKSGCFLRAEVSSLQ